MAEPDEVVDGEGVSRPNRRRLVVGTVAVLLAAGLLALFFVRDGSRSIKDADDVSQSIRGSSRHHSDQEASDHYVVGPFEPIDDEERPSIDQEEGSSVQVRDYAAEKSIGLSIDVRKGGGARQTGFSSKSCDAGEGLWELVLLTDRTPWENSWELLDADMNAIASGPKEGYNYGRETRYVGRLCLSAGVYRYRFTDLYADGLSSGSEGSWEVKVNGDVILRHDRNDDFSQRVFTFRVSPSGETEGVFLLMPRPEDPIMSIQYPDGSIFEMTNLSPEFDYQESGLVSGISPIVLPSGSTLYYNGTADVKGEAPVLKEAGFSSQAGSTSNGCNDNEGLWELKISSNDAEWELLDSTMNVALSGPREGVHRRCLPGPRVYYMRWSYEPTAELGDWSISVNGENVLSGSLGSRYSTEEVRPFVVSPQGEVSGTFLGYYRSSIQIEGGAIYELRNFSSSFERSDLVSGVDKLTLPAGTEYFYDGTANLKGKLPRRVTNRRLQDARDLSEASSRRLAVFKGQKSVLLVRVIVSDGETERDETGFSDDVFAVDSSVSMKSQLAACSYGKLNIVKAQDKTGFSLNSGSKSISNGVVTVTLPHAKTVDGDGAIKNEVSNELRNIFQVPAPELADHLIYCLPNGSFVDRESYVRAYAYINSWLSVFSGGIWCSSVSLLLHELGHNLNMGHSNEDGSTYHDQTGIMGFAYPNKDGPLECFNAAKSWQTGWYKDKAVMINPQGTRRCYVGSIHGIAVYPSADVVLLRVQQYEADYFIAFNYKAGINKGTQEAGNMVTVVTRPRGKRDTYAESSLLAKLETGETFVFGAYSITVNGVNLNDGSADIKVQPTEGQCLS